MRNKSFKVLGWIVGVILAALILWVIYAVAYGYIFGPGLDKSSKTWADDTIPKIVATWDMEEVINNGSRELLKNYSQQDLGATFATWAQTFGPMQTYGGAQGQASINFSNFHKVITAQYAASVLFANGSTTVSIEGIREDGTWKILGFHVLSQATGDSVSPSPSR